jgi:hypothetical protein
MMMLNFFKDRPHSLIEIRQSLDDVTDKLPHFQIAAEIENLNYEFDWSEEADSKAKVLASLVENHLLDAERSLFATARRTISVQDLNRLKMAYVEKCKDYLDHELSEARRALSDHMIQRSL